MGTKTHRWGVRYTRVRRGTDSTSEESALVQWQVGDWRPSREVMRVFEGLGRQEWLDVELEGPRNIMKFDMAYQHELC